MIKKISILALALLLTACANKSAKSEKEPHVSDADTAKALSRLLGGEPKKVDENKLAKYPLGSEKNPIRVGGPGGQRSYLSRLVCENNEPVSSFTRQGSAGPGPFGSIIDIYEVLCDTNKGVVTHSVYLDMYHGDYEETRPAAGFIALNPDCWRPLKKAMEFREQKNFNAALEQIELHNQCDKSEERMSYYYHLGWTYAEMGESTKAIEAYSEGLKTQPNYPFAFWRRGLAYEKLGKIAEAHADYKTAYTLGMKNNPEKFKEFLNENPDVAEKLMPRNQ
ncbi:MAG: tetratricopeptide repeat protein [Gammaproteobacteria bacterium]|nr:MAG: tetratricopeptide repeat protein [Gammaproteobacteria bacterium]